MNLVKLRTALIVLFIFSTISGIKAQSNSKETIGADKNNDRQHENLWISVDGKNVAHFGGRSDPDGSRLVLSQKTKLFMYEGAILNRASMDIIANSDASNHDESVRFKVAKKWIGGFVNYNGRSGLKLYNNSNLLLDRGNIYVSNGDVTLKNGNIDVKKGNIKNVGDITSTGRIFVEKGLEVKSNLVIEHNNNHGLNIVNSDDKNSPAEVVFTRIQNGKEK